AGNKKPRPNKSTVSTVNVENVVKEPINPVPMIKVYSDLIFVFRLMYVNNQPRAKQPIRLTKKVASGKPPSVLSDSLTANLDMVPKKPPIITNKYFILIPFLTFIYYNFSMFID